jgi:hypothetical protein
MLHEVENLSVHQVFLTLRAHSKISFISCSERLEASSEHKAKRLLRARCLTRGIVICECLE